MARIDGRSFSTFTKDFKKPFDLRFYEAMRDTVSDLVTEFNPVCGYTQSDEITLLWSEFDASKGQTAPFNGRLVKFASVLSGFTSVRFAHHLARQDFSGEKEQSIRAKIENPMHHFDCRVFNVPSRAEALNNMLWRQQHDCRRNSTTNLFIYCGKFTPKEADGLNTEEKLKKMAEHGVFYDDMHPAFRFGSVAKREDFDFPCTNPKTNEPLVAKRTRVAHRQFPLGPFSEEAVALLFEKKWPSAEPAAEVTPEGTPPNAAQ
jgi:tRNA(His) guanylyltransferase